MNFGLLALTFLSVNLDFFFILLFLLKRYSLRQVLLGYLLGVWLLLTLSFGIGKALAAILPEWALGVLGVLPLWLAFRKDDDDAPTATAGGLWTVMTTYLSVCAGCNLAIFLPVLAGQSWPHFLIALLFLGSLTLLVTLLVRAIGQIPAVTRVMSAHGERLMRLCYVAVGLWVFWDSGLITHLLALL
ncbi:cadmium resistance transporter [Lacticaseibacillus mingshuiensis]|uniref:Cadmium resistance transporter n=1 Tax=Lacticaseibacillus mingshuiensis TaxID=2799574 RepID=A0ABW4CKW2_9LACO|nr:cadmium resistance transporter [Lacticaseibacillus mingshuiensis]